MSPEQKTVALLLLALIALGSAYGYLRDNVLIWRGAEKIEPVQSVPEIMVHVTGAVVAPGVYALARGARIMDAISAAQGALESADIDSINLAAILVDGQRIHVPSSIPDPPQGTEPSDPRLDLNTATARELESLPGIGPVLAARIVEYRRLNGRFASLEDLKKVSGVGDRLLDRIRHLVRLR